MTTRLEIEIALKAAEDLVESLSEALDHFDSLAENNVFDDLEYAIDQIEWKLCDEAEADCEGSYCFGDDTYTQEFIVNGVRYIGTLCCEYDNHDKRYYYVDEHKFTYKTISE